MKKTLFLLTMWLWTQFALAQTNYVATSPASATPGFDNTLVGLRAGNSLTTGQRNLMVGNSAGGAARTVSNNVYLGFGATLSDTTAGAGESVYIGDMVVMNLKKGIRSAIIGHFAGPVCSRPMTIPS